MSLNFINDGVMFQSDDAILNTLFMVKEDDIMANELNRDIGGQGVLKIIHYLGS